MAIVRLQSTLTRDNALPEDDIVNGWHISTSDDVPANIALDTLDALAAFDQLYQDLDAHLGAQLSGLGQWRAYNLADATPRVPFLIEPITISPSSGFLPSEVAMVMSFHGTIGSGDIPARKRNRVFWGPLTTTIQEHNAGRVQITPTARNTAATSLGNLLAASDAAGNWTWQTFSPTTAASAGLSAAIDPVVGGWVDNAFDTQRRRGGAPTARTNFS